MTEDFFNTFILWLLTINLFFLFPTIIVQAYSETSLTGESRFHISTPQGILTQVPCDGKQRVSPLDQWDKVRMKWDCWLSTGWCTKVWWCMLSLMVWWWMIKTLFWCMFGMVVQNSVWWHCGAGWARWSVSPHLVLVARLDPRGTLSPTCSRPGLTSPSPMLRGSSSYQVERTGLTGLHRQFQQRFLKQHLFPESIFLLKSGFKFTEIFEFKETPLIQTYCSLILTHISCTSYP